MTGRAGDGAVDHHAVGVGRADGRPWMSNRPSGLKVIVAASAATSAAAPSVLIVPLMLRPAARPARHSCPRHWR